MTRSKGREKHTNNKINLRYHLRFIDKRSHLYAPLSIRENLCISYINWFECNKYINMKPLNISFREFFSEYSMLFPEREMYSNLAFMIVYITERGSSRWCRIESESEFSHKHLSLILNYPVIEFLESRREVWWGEYSSFFDYEFKWLTYLDRKIFSRVSIDETSSIHITEINCLSKCFTDRKCSTFILYSSIISGVTANLLNRSKCKKFSIHWLYSSCHSSLCKFGKFFLETHILWSTIDKTINKCI